MNALDLHNAIFTHEKSIDLPMRSASSFLHPAPERDESPTSQLFASAAYQDLIQRQPTHPNGPMSGWDLGLNLLGDPITAEEYKKLKNHQTKMKLRRLHAVNIVFELLFGIWATYITIRYFLAFADSSSSSGHVCALVLGTMSALVVALVTISLMMPLFPQRSHPNAWRRVRSLLRACYLLLLCAGPVMNLVLVIMWHPRQFCGWDIDISWYASGMHACRPAPFGAWIAAAIVRLAVTWTIVLLFIFTQRLYHETRHPSERSSPQYSPYYSTDAEDISPSSAPHPLKTKFARSDDQMVNRSNTTLPKYTSISTLAPSTSCTGHSRSHSTPPPGDISPSPPMSGRASIRVIHHGTPRSDGASQTQSVNVTDPSSVPHMLRHKSRVSLSASSHSDSPDGHTSRDASPSSATSRPPELRKTSTAWEPRHASQTSVNTSCSSQSCDDAYGYGAALPAYPYLELYNPREEVRDASSEGGSGEEAYVAMMGGYVRRMATIESLGSREASACTPLSSVRDTSTGVMASGAGSRSTAYLSFTSASGVRVNERGELVSARSAASSPYDRLYYTATSGSSFARGEGSG